VRRLGFEKTIGWSSGLIKKDTDQSILNTILSHHKSQGRTIAG
jgi:hypothetical protein